MLMKAMNTLEGGLIRNIILINIASLCALFSLDPMRVISQSMKLTVGLILIYFISKIYAETWFSLAEIGYFCTIILLMINLVGMGTIKRWTSIGGFFIQFSEFAKIAMLFMLAKFLAQNRLTMLNLIKAIFIVLIPSLLIFKQPNLGTTLIFLATGFSLIWVKGINKKVLLFAFVVAGAGVPIVWSKMLPYQKSRIVAFMDRNADPKGSSYQTIQSITAIGAGGIFGSNALHNKLGFVPENHTDFLFSCFAEHYGFILTTVLILLICATLLKLLNISIMMRDQRKKFFCIGFFLLWFVQVIMNIGMNIGILPVTGIVLPFFSYGGSSLLAFLIAIGIIVNFIKYDQVT